jgi:hypothetical protein
MGTRLQRLADAFLADRNRVTPTAATSTPAGPAAIPFGTGTGVMI